MTQWMQQLLWRSFSMSFLVLAYYAVTGWLGKRYAAKWFYLVGMILLAGFLIPFRPSLTIEIERAPKILQALVNQEAFAQPVSSAPSLAAGNAAEGSLWPILFIFWAVGAAATLAYHGIRHARFARAVKRWRVSVEDAALLARFDEAKRTLGLWDHAIGLAHCAWLSSPMLLRLDKPTVLLPASVRADDSSRFILLHELIHYKRKDLLCRLVMLLTTAAHWFNPVIYLLVKHTALQCEISCDEKAVENSDMDGKHQYAMSIISAARYQSKGYTLLTTYFYGGKDTMKKRISSIYEPQKRKIGVLLLACAMVLTLAAGTSIAADPNPADPNAGTIQLTLPEDVFIQANERLDSYIVKWMPLEDIKEYYLGIYYSYEDKDGQSVWGCLGGGWIGRNMIADGQGVQYSVENMVWDAMTLEGDATEADISGMLNKYLEIEFLGSGDGKIPFDAAKDVTKLLSANFTIVAVPESGAPITLKAELPVAK